MPDILRVQRIKAQGRGILLRLYLPRAWRFSIVIWTDPDA